MNEPRSPTAARCHTGIKKNMSTTGRKVFDKFENLARICGRDSLLTAFKQSAICMAQGKRQENLKGIRARASEIIATQTDGLRTEGPRTTD